MPSPVADLDPARLLDDLNDAQREAVQAVEGPVVILAAAGTGKTRVISRRTAYAIATEAVPADQALVVTFTDKAAGEMVDRLRELGLPGVTARTFHAHALSQLRHFWPSRHDGEPLPDLLDSKMPLLVPIARGLPGNYRFTAVKDLADEIEWAKSRRLTPTTYERALAGGGATGAASAADREPPIPIDLFVRVFAGYERAKTRAGRIDFDDLLGETIDLLDSDADAVETVRARKRWISVDEYQDTNPLQQRLLELWLGDRPDLCVVGDEDQTIYTFAGATSEFLIGFADRYPGARVITLSDNYRSSPQVLELANRFLAAGGRTKRLEATRPPGAPPTIERYQTEAAELAALVAWIRARLAEGTDASEIAVLLRMNAQLAPIEAGLTRADIPYQVRGIRFFDRPEVKGAIDLVRRATTAGKLVATGPALAGEIRAMWAARLGYEAEEDGGDGGEAAGAGSGGLGLARGVTPATRAGDEARERTAALDTLIDILSRQLASDAGLEAGAYLAELDRRRAAERQGSADGVNLLTYHRAKGLEWDAVALPMLEEGSLPIRQALDDDALLEEERRLFYVGLTRARDHLAISWAAERETRGRTSRRTASRFLSDLRPRPTHRIVQMPDRFEEEQRRRRSLRSVASAGADPADDDPLMAALRAWRTSRAREDQVPPYIVFHDQTLAAIAEIRPSTLAGLRRVKGIGPSKLETYGDEILEVVRANAER